MGGKLTVTLDGADQLSKKLKINSKKFSDRQARALLVVARQTQEDIETRGRESIAAGGNFSSSRWQQGFRAMLSFRSRGDIKIRVTHSVFYWKVFEFGATIHGKPMLWIPIPGTQAASRKVRARDFGAPLFRVTSRRGNPILMAEGGNAQYFGKESVRIPRKWRLRDVVRAASRRMSSLYKQAMRNG